MRSDSANLILSRDFYRLIQDIGTFGKLLVVVVMAIAKHWPSGWARLTRSNPLRSMFLMSVSLSFQLLELLHFKSSLFHLPMQLGVE